MWGAMMVHCAFCNEETDDDNLVEVDGAFVRVCENCRNNPDMGGLLYADKIEKENQTVDKPKPKIEHKSFDPTANWLAELKQIEKEQETTALVDEQALLKVTKELERLKNEEAAFKAQLQEIMERNGTKSLKTKYFTITYVEEHTQRKFDQKALEKAHPEIYAEFLKTSTVKASVKITMKKEKENE